MKNQSEGHEGQVIFYPKETGTGWMFDYYEEGWYEGAVPDGWDQRPTRSGLMAVILTRYPEAKAMRGVTGRCVECGEEHFQLEEECMSCGGELEE